jgi:soluble lytic murein transglycosylase-like protein
MDNDPFKSPFLLRRSVGVAPWLFRATIVLSLFLFMYYAQNSEAQPVVKQRAMASSLAPSLRPDSEAGRPKRRPCHRSSAAASEQYHPIIVRAAKRHAVDPALVKAIIMAESGYNARAVSEKGASGLMQLMPRTAEALGVEDAMDPEHNVNGGVRYVRNLLDQFNDNIKLAVAAYNAGVSKVREHQDVPPIRATQAYVKKVLEYYEYYKKKMEEKMDNV